MALKNPSMNPLQSESSGAATLNKPAPGRRNLHHGIGV
jgi:hypothetical protein